MRALGFTTNPYGRSEWDAGTLRERPFDLEAVREARRETSERFEAR